MAVVLAVALVGVSCGTPVLPEARSSDPFALVTATPLPVEPTPTPLPPPTAAPTSTPDPNQASVPDPEPTSEPAPGLSATKIRLAFIFDNETGGTADGLFEDALAGLLAWRKAVRARGGFDGLEIEIQQLDARLVNFEEKLREVCDGDYFAIVGSQSLGDGGAGTLLGSPECRVPNFPGEVFSGPHASSPVTYLANPFRNDVRQAGPAQYLAAKFPEESQNLSLFFYDALQLSSETLRLREMLVGSGFEPVYEPSLTLEEDLAEVVLPGWAEAGVESLWWNADPGRLVEVLELLDEPPAFVVCELGCYSQRFIDEGGDAVEGVRVWIPHRPFSAGVLPNELIQYQFYLNEYDRSLGWSETSLKSWIAGRLFEDVYTRLSQIEESFTRDQLLDVADAVDAYRVDDLLSFPSPTAGDPSPCFVLMVVQDGQWVQEHPAPALDSRDLDCEADNLYRLTATADLGLTETSSTSSDSAEPTPEPAPGEDLENPEEIPE